MKVLSTLFIQRFQIFQYFKKEFNKEDQFCMNPSVLLTEIKERISRFIIK